VGSFYWFATVNAAFFSASFYRKPAGQLYCHSGNCKPGRPAGSSGFGVPVYGAVGIVRLFAQRSRYATWLVLALAGVVVRFAFFYLGLELARVVGGSVLRYWCHCFVKSLHRQGSILRFFGFPAFVRGSFSGMAGGCRQVARAGCRPGPVGGS